MWVDWFLSYVIITVNLGLYYGGRLKTRSNLIFKFTLLQSHSLSFSLSFLIFYRIDANVDDAEINVEAAHHELLKYFKSVSSNRMLMIKVFGIMIVFFVIFVVFMA